MPKKTSPDSGRTRYLILGLLLEGPCSGYDIHQKTQSRFQFFWSESFGQIYPTLRRLEAAGHVERLPEKGRRQVFKITDAGRESLREWLASTTQPDTARSETILKYYFSLAADPPSIRRNLEQYRDRQRVNIKELQEFVNHLSGVPEADTTYRYALASIDLGLRTYKVWEEWADEQLALLPEDE